MTWIDSFVPSGLLGVQDPADCKGMYDFYNTSVIRKIENAQCVQERNNCRDKCYHIARCAWHMHCNLSNSTWQEQASDMDGYRKQQSKEVDNKLKDNITGQLRVEKILNCIVALLRVEALPFPSVSSRKSGIILPSKH
jgi:hypothetical protein